MKARGLTVRETVDARKVRYGAADLATLFADDREVRVTKGKQVLVYPINDETDWSALAEVALGRSGNLRAPTARVGRRVLVGWAEEAWSSL